MGSVVESRVFESAKLLNLPEEVKLEVFLKLGILASSVLGDNDISIIKENNEVYEILTADNVLDWVLLEKNSDTFYRAVGTSRHLRTMFESQASVIKVMRVADISSAEFAGADDIQEALEGFSEGSGLFDEEADDAGFDDMAQFGSGEDLEEVEENITEGIKVDGYIPEIHDGYRTEIENLLLTSLEELYGGFFNGQESIDGFVIPGGAMSGDEAILDGSGSAIKVQGILKVKRNGMSVEPNTISNALYEEFYRACVECGIGMVKEVEIGADIVKPYKYNPVLHRSIANGSMAGNKKFSGWREYSEYIKPKLAETTQKLAIVKAETESLSPIYDALSGYTMTLMVVNYKNGLGSQIRFNCGDSSKTAMVANKFVANLRQRERGHRALAVGNLQVSVPNISPNKTCAMFTIYQNIKGYQSVPTFMGELLYNIPDGQFRPSIDNMIIGKAMDNQIVTAPFTQWLLPIIAGSRSGKGVLTLNMLLNVIGTGTPLFYLDGKPDMASLLWTMMKKHGVQKGIVVDGVGFKGVTDIDGKPYSAPYAGAISKSMAREGNNDILENNFNTMVYLKTMLAILMSLKYYKEHMGMQYGNIFVVFDEFYKIFISQVNKMMADLEIGRRRAGSDRDKVAEYKNIELWMKQLMEDYAGNDIGVFGNGIKAVVLTQHANSDMYSGAGGKFCNSFLLRRATKLYGRQESSSGKYAVNREHGDDINYDLYNKYYHFGIGSSTDNSYNTLKTFKPLLVLNENDCKELTGKEADGAFIDGVIQRVSKYVSIPEFRKTYFSDQKFAESIGFEGALDQVGRLTGENWVEQFKLSIGRGYDIAEKALRHYGLLGENDVDNVYDFITDLRMSSLVSLGEIEKRELKEKRAKGEGLDSGSMFGLEDDVDEEESIDFDTDSAEEEEVYAQYKEEIVEPVDNVNILNREEQEYMKRRAQRTQEYREPVNERVEEPIIRDNVVPLRREIPTAPEEVYYGETPKSFETKGNVTYLNNSVPEGNKVEFNSENYENINVASNHPIHKLGKSLYKTFQGTQYEFKKRFKLILDAISSKIQSDVVTRIILAEDEITVNGRYIDISSVIGGYANIRLYDIVSFKELFKRFKNVKELTLDTTMYEALYIEKPNMPNGVFELSKNLSVVSIIDNSGRKEVIRRGVDNKSNTLGEVSKSNEFESICASKNPRLSEKSPGYGLRLGQSAKNFSKDNYKRTWEAVSGEKTSVGKAIFFGGVATVSAGVSLAGYSFGQLFRLFRR